VVWAFKGRPAPLTHRLTLVEFPEGNFIVDVGFGGQTATAPLRLEPGLEPNTPHGTHRVARDGEVFGLQLRLDARWETMYQFTLAAANWFTSTHPHSLFTKTLSSAEPWARLGSIWSTQTAPFGTLTDMRSHPPCRTPVNWGNYRRRS
jgi:arylamine N-acetyltransferase